MDDKLAIEVIRARITPEQKAMLEEAAHQEGLSLSAWMRMHLLRIARENLNKSAKK